MARRIRSEANIRQQRAYARAYHRALARLARAHPAEFTQMVDDELKAPERRAVLDAVARRAG